MRTPRFVLPAMTLAALTVSLGAQDRLKSMPGYEQYQKVQKETSTAIKSGAVAATWSADGKTFEYARDGRRYRFDVATHQTTDLGDVPEAAGGRGRGRGQAPAGGAPERGRQVASAASPDGALKAFYKDRNLWLSDAKGGNEKALTTDGSETARIKYGTASWVYGEELGQTTAMWWSPDSRKIAYYRFDEKQVPDFLLTMHLADGVESPYDKLDTEAYPKPGSPNPIVDLFVYDIASGKTTRVDVRGGKPFDNSVVGHYVYHVAWSPDGRELLFNRTNRRQQILEFTAANPDTGVCRVIVRDEWPTGWVNNSPAMVFLKDGKRFIWESERNGWRNFYLYDLAGQLITPLTTHTTFEVGGLVKVDEAAGTIFYTARDGDNFLKMQLHRVGLDGKGDARLTDPKFNHTVGGCMPATGGRGAGGFGAATPCGISPDNKYFVDVYQTHDAPSATRVVDASAGKVVADVATSDLTKFNQLGLKKPEMFTYTAADGRTLLRGMIQFPSTFDPSRKYPALVSVYGGPAAGSNVSRETFVAPTALAEYGFLILNLDSRAVPGMGKRSLDSIYLKLGQVEMDDMAAGVKALWNRPYFDKSRVGIYGTSYGGYSVVMEMLRHPDVFAAGSASSPPTDWRNYDTIYTERYMWIPAENKTGYDLGGAMMYAGDLKGRLLLYYGTADNNVHPSNTMQLIKALQAAGKSFDVQVGPDQGHSGVNVDRMMEFFIGNLVTAPSGVSASTDRR
jgi:dipeptidyl-peptidase-4